MVVGGRWGRGLRRESGPGLAGLGVPDPGGVVPTAPLSVPGLPRAR